MKYFSDKTLAIALLALIAICSMFFVENSDNILSACVGGISGLAVGDKISSQRKEQDK